MFLIRTAQSADIQLLVAMMDEFYGESDYPLDHLEAQRCFSFLLSNAALGCIWIASKDNQDVGYAVMAKRFSMEHSGMMAQIEDLFVRREWRGEGVGQLLLRELFHHCKEQNIMAVCVELDAQNPVAQHLYGKFGLQPHNDNRQTLVGKITQQSPHTDAGS